MTYDSLLTWLETIGPIRQALYAGLFTWGLTAIGAALVFLFNASNRKVLDCALGFTGGVMIAASFWSLLSPAIAYVELQNEMGLSTMPQKRTSRDASEGVILSRTTTSTNGYLYHL